jgi:hypothetical protein
MFMAICLGLKIAKSVCLIMILRVEIAFVLKYKI